MTETHEIYEPAYVKDVFDRCSDRYITFSYICSAGFTERWRRQCIEAMPMPQVSSPTGYDLMAGTGEVWPHLLKQHPDITAITAVDISSGMHTRAMNRLHTHRAHKIEFIEDDVLESSLPVNSADFIVSTFGLKTFNNEQHQRLAALIARTLKPGGVFSLVEASDPKGWIFRSLYNFHLNGVLPLIECIFLRGAQDFAMIGKYAPAFGNASAFAELLREEGLDVEYRRYFFGCATGVCGRKPQ